MNLVVRSTMVPIAERSSPISRSPPQWPGTAGSFDWAGRSLIRVSAVTSTQVLRRERSRGARHRPETAAELRAVAISVEQCVRAVGSSQLGIGDRGCEPAVVGLAAILSTRHVTPTGIPSAASSRTNRYLILPAGGVREVGGCTAQDLILLLKELDPFVRLAQHVGLAAGLVAEVAAMFSNDFAKRRERPFLRRSSTGSRWSIEPRAQS